VQNFLIIFVQEIANYNFIKDSGQMWLFLENDSLWKVMSCPFFYNDHSFNDLIKGSDFSQNTCHTVLPTPAHYNLQLT
jgi:hypothetical protein